MLHVVFLHIPQTEAGGMAQGLHRGYAELSPNHTLYIQVRCFALPHVPQVLHVKLNTG